jgi:uncharacterized protein
MKETHMSKNLIAIGALAGALAGLCFAAPTEDAKAIIERAAKASPWKSMASIMTMDLIDKAGNKKTRVIKSLSQTRPGRLASMIMYFQSPQSVEGTGYLTIQNEGRDDDSYIYLPSLRKVKRLAANGKSGQFMGSEFTYNEIGAPKVEDYDYALLGNEVVDGKPCAKIECSPRTKQIEEATKYKKILRWVSVEDNYTVMADYYDRSGEKIKTLKVTGIQVIMGAPFSTRMEMQNVQTGAKSIIAFSDIRTDVPISDGLFTERSLVKGW